MSSKRAVQGAGFIPSASAIINAKKRKNRDSDTNDQFVPLQTKDISKLDLYAKTYVDDSIVKEDYQSYLPYTLNANHNDTITIDIQCSDLITATYDSYICVKGTYEAATPNAMYNIVSNAVYFMFEEIQYKLGSNHIVDICKQPGITSTIKSNVSYDHADMRGLTCTSWNPRDILVGTQCFSGGRFSAIIPLKNLFGLFENYEKLIVNMPQSLVLIRSKNDLNCYSSDATDVSFTINKISWEVPCITLSDEMKLNLFQQLHENPSIIVPFRKWELNELPAFTATKNFVWRVKTSSELEKPRFILLAIQNNKMNVRNANPTSFDHADISNINVFLNSESFPLQRWNLDFQNNDYITAFLNYIKFRKAYYGDDKGLYKSLFNYADFKANPIFVIDCSRQRETVKDSTVNIRIEFESRQNFSVQQRAYCLIIHDSIIEYNPFTELVNKYIQ